jgi:hypothetical protein
MSNKNNPIAMLSIGMAAIGQNVRHLCEDSGVETKQFIIVRMQNSGVLRFSLLRRSQRQESSAGAGIPACP